METNKMHVGELARAAGKSVRAIHLYEQMGILRPVSRSEGGFRLFDLTALERVRWIEKLQDVGFTLPQIRALLHQLETAASAPEGMQRARALFAAKLRELREVVARLGRLQAELERSVDYLQRCDACQPPRLLDSCTECGQPRPDTKQPGLVSGMVLGTQRRS